MTPKSSMKIVIIHCWSAEYEAMLSFLTPKPPVPAVQKERVKASKTGIRLMIRRMISATVMTKYMT